MKKSHFLFVLILASLALLLLSSCADVSQVDKCLDPNEHTYGFWGGLWHGMIAAPAFIGSLIWDDIAVYAVNNNGGWYNFGFVLGVGGFTTGLGSKRS